METLKVILILIVGLLILRAVWAVTGKPFVFGSIVGSVLREGKISLSAIISGIVTALLVIGLVAFLLFALVFDKVDPSHTLGMRGDSEEQVISTLKQADYVVKYDGLVKESHVDVEGIVPGVKRYIARQKNTDIQVYLYFDKTGLVGNYGTRYE
jgi:hypothetical protein